MAAARDVSFSVPVAMPITGTTDQVVVAADPATSGAPSAQCTLFLDGSACIEHRGAFTPRQMGCIANTSKVLAEAGLSGPRFT